MPRPLSIFSHYLIQGESHGRCSLLSRTPCPSLDLGPFTPPPCAASTPRQRTRPQQHPRPARQRIHPFRARCGARPSPRRRPRRRPAGPPPDRHRPLRHRRGCRWRHRPGPGRRTGPGQLPGRARRRTPGLGTRPGLPGAMRAVPEAVPGAGDRIAPPAGNGTGMQPALTAPSCADRPLWAQHPTRADRSASARSTSTRSPETQ
jgi:hypothetical protein